jgi:RNA polymerase sigma factor for flagellar operon FliA
VKSDAFVYNARGTLDRQDYVRQYQPLVRRLAHQMIARLPANVELDDMIQAGMMGLMDAVTRFDEAQGVQFEAYAASRIRGSMLDELRANDWLPRSARKSQRDIENAIRRVEARCKRAATEAEIAREMNIPVHEYQELLNDARGAQLIYFEDLGSDGDDEDYLERHVADDKGDPSSILRDKRFRSALVTAIEDLPEREKVLMSMYYEQDMNLREIGAVMGVTESRVCQLHSQAVARLRAKLKNW